MRAREVIWGSPTYDQSRTAMDESRRAVGGIGEFNESRMSYTLPNGGRILYRSLDKPDTLRSKTAGGVVIDEAPFTDGRGWHEVIRPMLIDTGGWAWLVGTPKGRNWYWQEWQKALSRPGWGTFHAPTLGVAITAQGLVRKPHPLENPFIPFSEVVELYQSMPERSFRQEILAEFIEDGGGVFRHVRARATATRQAQAIPGHVYVMGLDWGRSNDYTDLSIVDATLQQQCYLDRFNQIDYTVQRGRVAHAYELFRPAVIIAESNSIGWPNIEMLQREGLPVMPFETTNATKALIVEALALAFERDTFHILGDETQIAELEAFELARLPSGLIRYSAPDGMHDDTVIGLALSHYGAGRMGSIFV